MGVSPTAFRRDWIGKSLAGLVLGLALAMGVSALFTELTPTMGKSVQAQLAMWMVMPVWMAIWAGCYGFASSLRAWVWLGGASVFVYAALLLMRLI